MSKTKTSHNETKINLQILEGVEEVEPLYWENWYQLTEDQKKYYVSNICSFFSDGCIGDQLVQDIHESVKSEFISQTLENPKSFIRDFYGVSEQAIEEIFLLQKLSEAEELQSMSFEDKEY